MVSALLAFHFVAMLSIAFSGVPSSQSQRDLAGVFAPYAELTALGSVHRYYAPAPPPTPIVTAELVFADGKVQNLRLPDRDIRPRLRYQRQLALAFHLYSDFQRAAHHPEGGGSGIWGPSYGRHLLAMYPTAQKVIIRAQQHLIPDLALLREFKGRGPAPADDPRAYTVPEVVGEFERTAR